MRLSGTGENRNNPAEVGQILKGGTFLRENRKGNLAQTPGARKLSKDRIAGYG